MASSVIKGAEGLTAEQMIDEVNRGGRFVTFPYCMSAVVITFRRSSPVHLIKQGDNAVVKSLPYIATSFFLGWWGFPFGLIYTPVTIITNLCGGKNVTDQMMASLQAQVAPPQYQAMPNQWPPSPNMGQ